MLRLEPGFRKWGLIKVPFGPQNEQVQLLPGGLFLIFLLVVSLMVSPCISDLLINPQMRQDAELSGQSSGDTRGCNGTTRSQANRLEATKAHIAIFLTRHRCLWQATLFFHAAQSKQTARRRQDPDRNLDLTPTLVPDPRLDSSSREREFPAQSLCRS